MKRKIVCSLIFICLGILVHGHMQVKKGFIDEKHPQNKHPKEQYCIPNENLFLDKNTRCTIDEHNVKLLKKLVRPTKCQIMAWIKPFLGSEVNGANYRLASIVKKSDAYTAITILRVFDISLDTNQKDVILGEGYLITIDKKGKFIDGIKIFDNFRTDDRDEENPENNFNKDIGAYVMYNEVSTDMLRDTIRIKEMMGLKKDYYSKEKSTYSEGLFLSKFVINNDGVIRRVTPREKLK